MEHDSYFMILGRSGTRCSLFWGASHEFQDRRIGRHHKRHIQLNCPFFCFPLAESQLIAPVSDNADGGRHATPQYRI